MKLQAITAGIQKKACSARLRTLNTVIKPTPRMTALTIEDINVRPISRCLAEPSGVKAARNTGRPTAKGKHTRKRLRQGSGGGLKRIEALAEKCQHHDLVRRELGILALELLRDLGFDHPHQVA